MTRHLHIGYFDDERRLLGAARECRDRGIPVVDAISPFPVHGIDEALGIRPSRLPWVTLVGGTAGAVLGLLLQYWTAGVNWPLNVGGKPLDSFPAFVPVAFELTILFSAFAAVFGMFHMNKLPRHHHPLFSSARFKRATADRFFISIEARDRRFHPEKTREFLESLRPDAVEAVED